MKRIITLLLSICFVVGLISGCADNDLVAYEFSKEFLNTLDGKSHTTGSIDIEFDEKAFEDYERRPYGEGYYYKDYNVDIDGNRIAIDRTNYIYKKIKAKVDFDIVSDFEKHVHNLYLKVECGGKKYSLGMFVYSADGIYATGDAILGCLEFYNSMNNVEDSMYKNEKFKKELQILFSKKDLIELTSFKEYTFYRLCLFRMFMPLTWDVYTEVQVRYSLDLFDKGLDIFKDIFDGFESGVIQKKGTGFEVTFNEGDFSRLIMNISEYIFDDSDENIKKLIDLGIDTLYEQKDVTYGYYEDLSVKDLYESLSFEDREVVKKSLKNAFWRYYNSKKDDIFLKSSLLMNLSNKPEINSLMKRGMNSHIAVKKEGEKILLNGNFYIKNNLEIPVKVDIFAKAYASDDNVIIPENYIADNDFRAFMNNLYYYYNPIIAGDVEISIVDSVAMVSGPVKEDDIFFYNHFFRYDRDGNTHSERVDFINEDSRIYLPLREISKMLGDAIIWDYDQKVAYVIKGEEKIEMNGILKDSKTYIKVRDFEKLGYVLEYQERIYHPYSDTYSLANIKIKKQ